MAILLSTPALASTATIPFKAPADITLYRLAEQNDPSAQFLVGRKYFTGNAVEKNISEAIKWFELAATQKHTKAQFQLGIIYLYGETGIKPNHVYALNYLREAAKNHYAEAQYEMGNYYLMGKTENVNYPEAVKWYRAAAKQQHVPAMVALGKILNEGRGGIKTQPDEAKQLLSLAAESGNADAMEYLREMVRHSSETYRNAASITDFNATLNDASAGHIPSQYEVGMAYLKGNGVEADMKQAAKWIRRAAMNDHPEAQYILSQLYRDGVGTEKNRRRALEWLKIAATAGVPDAQKELRSMYLSNSSLDEADEQTAQNDDTPESIPPISDVIIAITEVPEEEKTDNSTNEDSESKPNQSASVTAETFVDKNPSSKVKSSPKLPINQDLYSLDLQPTDAENQFHLANRYLTGNNLFKDERRAAYWFEQAAMQEHIEAQYKLGELYKQGTGVTASVAKAKFWLSKAADAGSHDAAISLRDLNGYQISNKSNVMKTSLPVTELNTASAAANAGNINKSNERDEKPAEGLSTLPQDVPNLQANAGMLNVLGKGNGASREVDNEINSLIEAANNNELDAQVKLAEMYRKGKGVERDLVIAAQWYQKAATEGDAEAQFKLGDMYKQGAGV
ncbi:tetratricopeptide repeat protein, partial [Kaarinaea lacus]